MDLVKIVFLHLSLQKMQIYLMPKFIKYAIVIIVRFLDFAEHLEDDQFRRFIFFFVFVDTNLTANIFSWRVKRRRALDLKKGVSHARAMQLPVLLDSIQFEFQN